MRAFGPLWREYREYMKRDQSPVAMDLLSVRTFCFQPITPPSHLQNMILGVFESKSLSLSPGLRLRFSYP